MRVAVSLLVFAALLRSLLPAGYMPDLAAARDGRLTLVICTPYGIQHIPAPDENGAPPAEMPGEPLCAFASAAAPAIPAAAGELPANVESDASLAWRPALAPLNRRLARPQAARAPPILS